MTKLKPWEDPTMRGHFMMLLCECNHKEHGHKKNVGPCSRCTCQKFVEGKTSEQEFEDTGVGSSG